MASNQGSHEFRHEAHILDHAEISRGQFEAMKRLHAFLHHAAEESVSSQYANASRVRVLLLSGARGSGKTSVVSTLRRWFDPSNSRSTRQAGQGSDVDVAKLEGKCTEISGQIDWAEPISLDPISPGANLVSAVFARIFAWENDNSTPIAAMRGLGQAVHARDHGLHDLDNMRIQAVSALEGNIELRRGGMEPEVYSNAVNDIEERKVHLRRDLERVLDSITSGVSRAIGSVRKVLVITIDDLDMRPTRAAEALRLAYLLNCRRVVFLLLGSETLLDEAVRSAYVRELRETMTDGTQETAARIAQLANELSSSALRKMLPLHQRIEVPYLELHEGEKIAFRETSAGSEQSPPAPGGVVVPKPSAMLTGVRALNDSGVLGHLRTAHTAMLEAPPRSVIDLAAVLDNALVNPHPGREAQRLAPAVQASFLAAVDEDARAGAGGQRVLAGLVHSGRQYDWVGRDDRASLEDSQRHALCVVSDERVRWRATFDQKSVIADETGEQIRIAAPIASCVEVGLPKLGGSGAPEWVPMGAFVSAAFATLYDLARLHPELGTSSARFEVADISKACSAVDLSNVDWPSLFHAEVFLASWRRGVMRVRRVNDEKAKISGRGLVALTRLYAMTAILDAARCSASAPNMLCRKDASYGWVWVGEGEASASIAQHTARLTAEAAALTRWATTRQNHHQDDRITKFAFDLATSVCSLADGISAKIDPSAAASAPVAAPRRGKRRS